MKFEGIVTNISDVQTGTSKSGKDWKKQDVVIEEESAEYPNSLSVTFFNKEIDFKVGDLLDIDFNIKANEFKGRWFNNLTIFKWNTIKSANTDTGNESYDDMPTANNYKAGADQSDSNSGAEDLPF